jgi:ketosteroid isomerase-like protein
VNNLEIAKQYLAAIEGGAVGDALADFFTPDATQEEFPNRFFPQGAKRDLPLLLEGAKRGQEIFSTQRYEILNIVGQGDSVAIEVQWSGVLAVPLATWTAGTTLRARIATFLEFRDGKIARQRNYDCYES